LKVKGTQKTDDTDFITKVGLADANTKQTSGWFYRVPARGQIYLETYDRNMKPDGTFPTDAAGKPLPDVLLANLGVSELTIAQYGKIISLPAKSSGRTSSSNIILDEATGALKNYTASSSPLLDENTIKDAKAIAQTVIDASDPVAKKKRELELLQLQNQINTERKKLDGANAPQPSPTP
jgi:hypothetical protein